MHIREWKYIHKQIISIVILLLFSLMKMCLQFFFKCQSHLTFFQINGVIDKKLQIASAVICYVVVLSILYIIAKIPPIDTSISTSVPEVSICCIWESTFKNIYRICLIATTRVLPIILQNWFLGGGQ